jgi:hypothetical protein
MNSIATRALASALSRAQSTPAENQRALPAAQVSDLVITGPINKVMELEGKRYAFEFVRGLGASIRREPIRAKAIADLTRYAVQQPSSEASGVKIVIDVLKGA